MVQRVGDQTVLHLSQQAASKRSNRGHQPNNLQHLKTRLGSAKEDWVDEFPNVLWAYEQRQEPPLGISFYPLLGTEAVAPAEIGELSWRVKCYDQLQCVGLRTNLDFLDEVRKIASVRATMYKSRGQGIKCESYAEKLPSGGFGHEES
ncbi:UNVERIFIED_CONTAM: hypothetical protein Sangu_2648900 [Sesamum angustifolium]|uniref:Uncharacterized protein n=1 Tax=Sesamum angustifolium TaxID=2727405 RepID=A0AAW2J3H7_9LAMI